MSPRELQRDALGPCPGTSFCKESSLMVPLSLVGYRRSHRILIDQYPQASERWPWDAVVLSAIG